MKLQLSRFLQLLVLSILTFSLVAACRGNAPKQAIQTGDTPAESVRIVEHFMGQTKVPINPQRVVVLGSGSDTVLSLGVKPLGSVQLLSSSYYLEDRVKGIKDIGSRDSPNFESIVALAPDLILGAKYNSQNYELLSQIAPTVIAEVESTGDWQKMLQKYAEALGLTDKANQIMADYSARLNEFQARMGDRLQQTEVSIVRVRQDKIEVYLEDLFCGTIVADAGLPRPPSQINEQDLSSLTIGKEVLQKVDGDVIFVWTYGDNKDIIQGAQTTLKQLKADPLWSKLKAVQQDKVYEVSSYWYGVGPIAANLVIDDLFKYLVESNSV